MGGFGIVPLVRLSLVPSGVEVNEEADRFERPSVIRPERFEEAFVRFEKLRLCFGVPLHRREAAAVLTQR
ncbi:MAG: hypothetical protein V3W34_15400 [Phycisphaerae bacterium]